MKSFNISSLNPRGAKKRAIKRGQAAEERVSLVDRQGRPTTEPSERKAGGNPWTLTRFMRYLSLTAVSAMVTFFILGRESKNLHWEEYHHLLEPKAKGDYRCYSEQRHHQNERCTCPDPAQPLSNSDSKWTHQHNNMLANAKKAPRELDIVFLGDDTIERWNGTKNFGTEVIPGMKDAFEKRFTKKGGGALEGLALGSSTDTGPNLLWHLRKGLITSLDPKIWFISVGTNDLFEEKCTNHFVVANVLNVIKTIYEIKPNSYFIVHGILPRKDNPDSKSQFLRKKWKYAQAINTQIRKFTEHSSRMYYMQAGPLFLEESKSKGRRQIDQKLLEDGMYPTKKGMEVWGDYLVKRVMQIFQDMEKIKEKGLTEASRHLRVDSTATNWTIS